MDQVGVKAPGRPTMIMFLPLAYSAMSIFSTSGKPWNISTEGSLSPAATLRAVAERAFDTEGAKAAALPARAAARRSFMAVVFGLVFNDFVELRLKEWRAVVVAVGRRSRHHQQADQRRWRRTDVLAANLQQPEIANRVTFTDTVNSKSRGEREKKAR